MESEGVINIEIIISIILGIVLGVLLYSIYKPPVIIHGPNSRDIVDRIFTYGGKKFKLDPKICACSANPQKSN